LAKIPTKCVAYSFVLPHPVYTPKTKGMGDVVTGRWVGFGCIAIFIGLSLRDSGSKIALLSWPQVKRLFLYHEIVAVSDRYLPNRCIMTQHPFFSLFGRGKMRLYKSTKYAFN